MRDRDHDGYAFQTALITPRLTIRPVAAEDADAVATLAAHPRVRESMAGAPGGAGGEIFVAVERPGGAIVGLTGCCPRPDRPAAVEISTCIAAAFWGLGYGTEVTHAMIDRAFGDGRTEALWCASRVGNARARRVIEKCGFQFRETGMVRSAALGAVPVERYVLERRNWTSLKSWGAPPMEECHAPHDNAA